MMVLFIAVWLLVGFLVAPFLIDQLREEGKFEEYPLSILAEGEGFVTALGALLGWITVFTVLYTYFSKLWYERRHRRQVRKLKKMRDKMKSATDRLSKIDPGLAEDTMDAYNKIIKHLEDEN